MVINLKQLYEITGECMDISAVVSDERLSEINGYSFIGPVNLSGVIRNRAGVVTLECTSDFTIRAECGRCLKRFERSFSFKTEYVLVRECNSDNDEYVVTPDDTLDLDELIACDIILQMPTKLLCREDCKGLCPQCGTDLNESCCGCESRG